MPDWNDFLELAKDGIEEVEERWDEIVSKANRMYKKWRYEMLVGKLENRIEDLERSKQNLSTQLSEYRLAYLAYASHAPNDEFTAKQNEVDAEVETVITDMEDTISRLHTAKSQAQERVNHYS